MREGYQPASEFLKAFVGNEQRAVSEIDLGQLVTLTRDADASNRDWATFLLAQEDFDTPAIRAALIHATSDTDANVRAEAIWGLTKRDPHLALPLVQEALRADSVEIPIFEAAELCAHPSLVADLRPWTEPFDAPYADEVATDALEACEKAAEQDS